MVQGEGRQGRPGSAGAGGAGGAPEGGAEAPPALRAPAGGLQGVGGSGAQPRRAGRPSQRTEVR